MKMKPTEGLLDAVHIERKKLLSIMLWTWTLLYFVEARGAANV